MEKPHLAVIVRGQLFVQSLRQAKLRLLNLAWRSLSKLNASCRSRQDLSRTLIKIPYHVQVNVPRVSLLTIHRIARILLIDSITPNPSTGRRRWWRVCSSETRYSWRRTLVVTTSSNSKRYVFPSLLTPKFVCISDWMKTNRSLRMLTGFGLRWAGI